MGSEDLGLPQLALASQLRENSPSPLSTIAAEREEFEILQAGGKELGIEKIPELRVSLERGREGKECADWRGQKRIKKKDEE